jgi:hypothetical protein
MRRVACDERSCALRAPTLFSVRIKTIRTENKVMVKSKDNTGFYTRSSIVRGWLYHPRTIDDPRGRFFVRAGFAKTCALRAPTLFSVRIKTIRTENKVIVKNKNSVWFCTSCTSFVQEQRLTGLPSVGCMLRRRLRA